MYAYKYVYIFYIPFNIILCSYLCSTLRMPGLVSKVDTSLNLLCILICAQLTTESACCFIAATVTVIHIL